MAFGRAKWRVAVLVGWAALLAGDGARAGEFDWNVWERILAQRVRPATIAGIRLQAIDYPGLRAERAEFDGLVARLAGADPSDLRGPRQLAFWINAYNLGAVRLVLDNPGVDSITAIGPRPDAVWKANALRIGGRDYSLDQIEHGILRKLDEPRIHFAIVCASVSCPDLRAEAYRADRLEAQLADQTRRFLANPGKGLRFDAAARRLRVTKLFEWFADDFGGPAGVRALIARHLPESAPADWSGYELVYLDYDWKLNTR
jgi:hypothetical protein